MDETTTERQPGATPVRADKAFGAVGFLVVVLGMIGAVSIWADMTSTGFGEPDYSSAEIWSAVLPAVGVATLGLIVGGIGIILGRLPDSGR